MRVLYIYCHPLAESFHAGIRTAATATLKAGGHDVDLLDLYGESFEPVLSGDERRHYFESPRNQIGVETYVARLKAAEALVLQFPAWCFGPPAILKGFFDRVMIPGVAFDASDPGDSKSGLANIRKIVGVVTYGQSWLAVLWMGDRSHKTVTRFLRAFANKKAKAEFHAMYRVDNSTAEKRAAFIAEIRTALGEM
jgi:putative NADPH-quinone reductase